MNQLPTPAPKNESTKLIYFIEGMDCASCVQKVENMVSKLPGSNNVKTSFSRQILELHLEESLTTRSILENNLRSLGYNPSIESAESLFSRSLDAKSRTNWYHTKQGKSVLVSGSVLFLAYILGYLESQLAIYGYITATMIGVAPLIVKAWNNLRLGNPFSVSMLVSLAAIGAILIGEATEGAVVVFFFTLGELLEGVAASKAREGIQSLAALTPKTALLLNNGSTHEILASNLKLGDVIQINPGSKFPADGEIIAGSSSVDDSPITGESTPILKQIGSLVFAGSINTDSVLNVIVTKEASDNTIARIIKMVEEAESSKAQSARFIDRFSKWYTPLVVTVSALTAVIPPLLFGQEWHSWLYKGLALLLIGCPCALVLSVPASITSAISAGARRGLLIKGGAVLETIGSINTIAFDKTGTLTQGKPCVTNIIGVGCSSEQVLQIAGAIESGSSHPLAKAITNKAKSDNITLPVSSDARSIPGKGVSALIEGQIFYISSPIFAKEKVSLSDEVSEAVKNFENSGKTTVVLHNKENILGIIAIRDEERKDAKLAITYLNDMGIQSIMLTGDNTRTGKAIANNLGIAFEAELLPEDKLKVIKNIKAKGKVAMVGDGINDAPALALADVGIAMGGGTDVALETADSALMRENLIGVAEMIKLSRDTMMNIKQNIVFALGLKLIFLITTLFGFTNLWMAILADTGATVIVTANALRLLNWKGYATAKYEYD